MIFEFDETYNQHVREDWNNFINHNDQEVKYVRKEILEAWEMFRNIDLNPYTPEKPKSLSKEEMDQIYADNELMCDIALPFMENVYEQIKGSSSVISLMSKDCVVLHTIRDPDYDDYILDNALTPGSVIDIKTGNIEPLLCKKYLKPIWCWDEENYCISNKGWACVAVPVFDDNHELAGILSVSNEIKNAHKYAMGMAISIAKAVENEIRLRKSNTRISILSNQFSSTIESIPQGIVVVKYDGTIRDMNHYAKEILEIGNAEVIGNPVGEVIIEKSGFFSRPPTQFSTEREMLLMAKNGYKRYYVTTKAFTPVLARDKQICENWTLIIIRKLDAVRKIANKILPSYARYSFEDIIGESTSLKKAINHAKIAAKSSSTVLIVGASGTGKELFANSIHAASARADGPFVSINCGALPSGLIESELFGYEGGAFTGARKNGHLGKFELADGGTLFLDEIGEMPLSLQASLLRVLETKEITRLGGDKSNVVDVRIIAATNKNLLEAIKAKEFREDLYYRLNVLKINVPKLKDRGDDVRALATKFMNDFKGKLNKPDINMSEEAMNIIRNYDWPGNVRELENTIERIISIYDDHTIITSDDLLEFLDFIPEDTEEDVLKGHPEDYKVQNKREEMERSLIIEALKKNKGSISASAKMIGVSRKTLYKKCEEYHVSYQDFRTTDK